MGILYMIGGLLLAIVGFGIFYAAGNTTHYPLPVTAPFILLGVTLIIVGIYMMVKAWRMENRQRQIRY